MKKFGIARCIAAAAVSLTMCLSAGISVSAGDFKDPAIEAGIIDENGNINSAIVYSSGTSSGSLSIPRSSVTLKVGSSYTLKPSYDTVKSEGITFSSRNKKIATVTQSGRITAVAAGNTYITCKTSDGDSVSMKVTVTEKTVVPAEKIYFTEKSHTMNVGETWRAVARIAPKGCTYTVKYSSSDKNVATVAKTGDVTAVGAGRCTVTITTDNGISDTMEIEVTDPFSGFSDEYIEFGAETVYLTPNEKVRPGVTCYPEGAAYEIKYTSSDKTVAKVSTAGTILAVAPGTAQITASSGAMYDTVEVIVTEDGMMTPGDEPEFDADGNVLPSKIEFTYSSESLRTGDQIRPEIRVIPANAVFEPVYMSSDPTVASVSHDGTITAVGEGSALITVVTANDKSDSFYVTVYNERYKGIDVSKWQGDIDWAAVSSDPNVEFVMIRASYGREDTDKKLVRNVEGCEKYGIPYGFYHYLYAETVDEAVAEADFFLSVVGNYSPTYPLVLDIEEPFYQKMTKQEVTDIVCAFMERIENAGYYAMIYSFAKFYDDCLIQSRVNVYDNWVACWGDESRLNENFGHPYGMWQYSETGHVSGIEENVDLNYCYKNYPYIIRKYNLNNL